MFNKQKYMDIALAGLASKPNQLEHVYIGDNSFEAKKTLEMAEKFLQREMFPKLNELFFAGELSSENQRIVAMIIDFGKLGITFDVKKYQITIY